MKVTEIKSTEIKSQEIQAKSLKDKQIESKVIQKDKLEINTKSYSPINALLIDKLELLENNKQLDNTNPLDRPENAPIESFEEAVKVLNLFKSNISPIDLLNAQANLINENVLDLFITET